MKFLEQMLALLLHISLLPFYLLYKAPLYVFQFIIVTIKTLINAQLILKELELYKTGNNLLYNFLITITVVIPLLVTLIPLALIVFGTYLFIANLINIFKNGFEGIFITLDNGLAGLKRVVNKATDTFWELHALDSFVIAAGAPFFLNRPAEVPLAEERYRGSVNSVVDRPAEIPQRYRGPVDSIVADIPAAEVHRGVSDVITTNHAEQVVPNLQNTEIIKVKLLRQTQLKTAKNLITTFAHLDPKLPNEAQDKLTQLKVLIYRYEDLSKRLKNVRKALFKKKLDTIEDQVIVLNEITNPIILYKQYLGTDNNWHNVPANGYITDKDALITWLKSSRDPKHPLTNDSLKSPPDYKEEQYPTRYQWHLLTKRYCTSQELGEAAVKIRGLSKILTLELQKIQHSSGASAAPVYGIFAAKNSIAVNTAGVTSYATDFGM